MEKGMLTRSVESWMIRGLWPYFSRYAAKAFRRWTGTLTFLRSYHTSRLKNAFCISGHMLKVYWDEPELKTDLMSGVTLAGVKICRV